MTKILEKIMDIPSIGLEVKVMIIYTPKSRGVILETGMVQEQL